MFAFSQIDPETRGQVAAPKVPLSRYLGANWDQGFEDSAFRSVEKITEMGLADPDSPGLLESATMSLNEIADRSAPKISAEEANNKYSLPGLTFERPVIEAQARLINERRRAELERSYYLDDADTNPLRWTTGMGSRIAGGMMNPLDLGINFMPIVGSEKAAANVLGRGTREGASALEQLLARPRAALARGFIAEESLAKLPEPHFTASLINGAVGQATFEVPVAIAKMQELQDYNASDFAEAILGGAAFAGALHVALAGAGRLFRRLRPETREVMLRKAVDDFVKGNNISVHDLVTIDDNVIKDRVKWDPQRVRAEAEAYVNEQMPELAEKLKNAGEEVVAAAIKTPEGEIFTGTSHYDLEGFDEWLEKKGLTEDTVDWDTLNTGFVTDTGRFIDREEAFKIGGHYDAQSYDEEGGFDEVARKKEKENLDLKALKAERQKAIKRFIEKKRREFDPDKAFSDEVRAEIQRQVAEGKVVGPEASKKYGATDLVGASDVAKVEEDVKELERQLGLEESKQQEKGPKIETLSAKKAFKEVEKIKEVPPGSEEVDPAALEEIEDALSAGSEGEVTAKVKVVRQGGKIVAAASYDEDASGNIEILHLGSLGGKNGTKIFNEIVAEAHAAGKTVVFVARDTSIPFYQKLGLIATKENSNLFHVVPPEKYGKDLPDLDKAIDAGTDCIIQNGL